MARSSFVFNSTNQELHISVDQIIGSGGADSPCLSIPITIDFNPLEQRISIETPQGFDAISIKGTLYGTESNFKISESVLLMNAKIRYKNTAYEQFQFPLSLDIINRLEKNRKGGMPLRLQYKVQIATYESITVTNDKNQKIEKPFVTGFLTGQGDANFVIEQSQWVNKILNKMGHHSYKLVELPAINNVIPAEYEISLNEFEEARKYFLNGDYDKTVAHCRAALDPFAGKTNLPKLKEFVKSKSEFEWATRVTEATEEWLDKIIKSTFYFTSKTHHAPSIGHFSRTEAEIVLMITTGIVAYIGKIEYKPE